MKLLAVFKPQTVNATIPQPKLNAGFGTPIVREVVGDDPYDGPYEVTPTQSTQTLETALKTCVQNIVINPIPSNYGLITYNGSVLTVS